MLLHGSEIHWYESGIKEYEVTWSDGRKIGVEDHWNPQGQLVWRWNHRPDGVSKWTRFHTDGSIRTRSTWRDGRLLDASVPKD
jgi:antitoxin component YwqK of YwqJK toxin-antitoxin module